MAIESVVEEVAEEVATNLEEVAHATRSINATAVGYFIGGVALGAVVGFYFGYRFNREKIKAEVFAESEKEVEKIREVYMQKSVVAEPKPSIEKVIEERGYSVVEPARPLRAPVPLNPNPVTAPPPPEPPVIVNKHDDWHYPYEIANRNPDEPYVIHQDERRESPGYAEVAYTYYAGDDVLVDENNIPLPHGDLIVGQENLKFGHGADDENVVFVRNEKLELIMEICRTPKSYEEEVLGLDNHEED